MIFLVEVQLIYNVVLVSGVQQSDQVSYIHMYSFPDLCHYRLLQDIEYGSLCHRSLSFIYFIYSSIRRFISNYLFIPLPYQPNSICKGPDSKQFALCRLPCLHCSYSSLLSYQESIHRQWQWVECVPIKVYFYLWLSFASLVTQTVKNPPAMQETWYRSLGWEDPLEEGMVTHSSIPAWRITMDRGAWQATVHGVAKSQT